jgi:LysR family hydrogen peroxide-inducible transcriptional activator
MNLRDLQYLAAVADHLHFGKAAEACNVSQPTLSMQLKKLEETLGVQLFERTNKSVMLTAIGSDITMRAKRILEESQQLREAAKAAVNPLSGDLRLGIFPTLAPYLLPSLMPKLKKQFPLLNLLLVEEKTASLITQLEEGKIDCAMLAMPVDNPALDSKKLFDEPFVLAVPKTHALAKRTSVSQSEIQNETLLLLEEGHCLREQALEVCSAIGMGESNSFRATSLETLRHMVAAGNALTLMPKLSVRNEDALVRYIPFKKPAPMRSIGLYWRKTSPRSLLFTQIGQMVAAAYK